jgi:hypothetical protein
VIAVISLCSTALRRTVRCERRSRRAAMEFRCQSCHVRLQLTGVEALRDVAAAAAQPEPQVEEQSQHSGSAAAQSQPQGPRASPGAPLSPMDESFVVLDNAQRNTMGHASAPGAHE